jgi:hypothetical protein
MLYFVLPLLSQSTCPSFSDTFSREDGLVGNGWANTMGNTTGDLLIHDGALTTPGPGAEAGIYRPMSFTAPLTVSATLTQANAFGGLLNRYNIYFLFGNDGGVDRGYGIHVIRSDQDFDSFVAITVNGVDIMVFPASFQFGSSIVVNVTFDPANNSLTGSVTGDGNRFPFSFAGGPVALTGSSFAVEMGFPDSRSSVIVNPTIDNLSLVYSCNIGIDLSVLPSSSDWTAIVNEYHPKFIIADAWGGESVFPAGRILSSIPSDIEVHKAAYALLNWAESGPNQVRMAESVRGIDDQIDQLAFIAIDVEATTFQGTTSEERNKIIYEAVQAVKQGIPGISKPLNAFIYTNSSLWRDITKNTKSFGCLPLWDVELDNTPVLSPANTLPYGGWTTRAGKQYAWNRRPGESTVAVDLDVFDPLYFLSGNWGMASDITGIPGINSPRIHIRTGPLTFDSTRQLWQQTVTLFNASGIVIQGPVSLALDNLNGFLLVNGSGSTSCTFPSGSPYITVSNADFQPNQSLAITLFFFGSSASTIHPTPYTARVLAGAGVR